MDNQEELEGFENDNPEEGESNGTLNEGWAIMNKKSYEVSRNVLIAAPLDNAQYVITYQSFHWSRQVNNGL